MNMQRIGIQRVDARIVQAMRLLEQRMGETIDYEQIAANVGLSASRFHHLFAAEVGETPGDYLRRIRLDAAALRLRWTREKVGEIAAGVGYSSQPSFTQAFTRRYDTSPIRFRHDRQRWQNESADHIADKRVRIVQSESFHCLAKRYVGAPCHALDYWTDFLSSLPEGFDRREQRLFVGLLYDDMRFTPPDRVRYDCCVTVSETFDGSSAPAMWPGLHRVDTQPGLYASIRHKGCYAASLSPEGRSISQTYSYLLDEWVPNSRYAFGGECAIEVYTVPQSRCALDELECTVLVPLM